MLYTPTGIATAGVSPASELMDDREAFSDVFAPVIAGARARGIADAFELLGMHAILIDAAGRVLHVSPAVHRLLAPAAEIVEDHLLGCDPAARDTLQRFISSVVGDSGRPDDADETIVRRDGDVCGFRIRAIRFPVDEEVRSQLLRAVLVVSADPG